MAPVGDVRRKGISSLSPGLLTLWCTVALLLGTCQGLSMMAPFQAYPPPEFCGSALPPGFPPIHLKGGPQSCPMDVCPDERRACQVANEARKQCMRGNCGSADREAAYADATAKCGEASDCVKAACASVVPWNGHGQPCRVRTFLGGQCCCPSCRPRIPRIQTDDPWGPFFNGEPGEDSSAAIHVRWQGMEMGECAIINSETDLSSIVVGQEGAKVYSICSSYKSPPWDYQVLVDAEGGSGAGMKVVVVDNLGTEHEIVVSGAERASRVVGFNADVKPKIQDIRWNNIHD